MSLLDQVRTTIEQHGLFERGDTVVVAVSGGADSLALLHCLRALRDELQIALHVAHLNHQLRGAESDADAEFVAWLAREWNLPATIEARDVSTFSREQRLSIEEAARHARYAFLAQVAQRIGARVIAVAHNADDQEETIVMHLLRGAGMAGLRGMPYDCQLPIAESRTVASEIRLVRPLLDLPRAEIEDYCKANALAPRLDRSNLDTTLFRNRLRREVLPYLETLNPNLRQILLRTARVLGDDYNFLQAQVRTAYSLVTRGEGSAVIFAREAWRSLHPALQRGTLRMAVQQLRGDLRDVDWTHIEDARRVALQKPTGMQVTLSRGLTLTVGYLDFMIADAARSAPLPDLPLLPVEHVALPAQGITSLPDSDWVVETEILDISPAVFLGEAQDLQAHSEPFREVHPEERRALGGSLQRAVDRWRAVFDFAKCQDAVYLRRRRAGDRFHPFGLRGHTQSLAEFMIDAKIPRAARDRLPLLATANVHCQSAASPVSLSRDEHRQNDDIIWVCGWRVGEHARVTGETRALWRVTFRKKETR